MSVRIYNTEQLSEPTHKVLLANSLTVNIGDVLFASLSTGVVTATNAAASVGGVNVHLLGVVAGFCDVNDQPLPLGYSSSNANQSSIATGSGGGIYAMFYDPTDDMIFSADLTQPSGTTTGSNAHFVYFNFSSSVVAKVDEMTVTRTLASANQVYSLGVDPQNSSAIICKLVCTDTRGHMS